MKDVRDLVFDQVEDFVNSKTCFTAFDVTNALRKSNSTNVRHSLVRETVNNLYSTNLIWASYTRTPIEVQLQSGEMKEAFLYHPVEVLQQDLDKHYTPSQRGLFDSVDQDSDQVHEDKAHNGAFDLDQVDMSKLPTQAELDKLQPPKPSLGSRILSMFKSKFFK